MKAQTDQEEVADAPFGMHQVLSELVRGALREIPDLVSIALGDHQGLPIISATRGKIPAMTFTAMATMSLQAAKTAADAVGLEGPDYMVVHSENGELVVVRVRDDFACLIGLLSPGANLGFALVTLRRLAEQINQALE